MERHIAAPALLVYCFDVGSSSLKFAAYELAGDRETLLVSGAYSGNEAQGLTDHVGRALADAAKAGAASPDAIGHRIVFGGRRHTRPVVADKRVLGDLASLVPYDPLHLQPQLEAVLHLGARFPNTKTVLCFDTMFGQSMPEVARRFALPPSVGADVVRFGFHGLSYEYVVSMLEPVRRGRAIIAHLGAGASMCALADGKPKDTTMGFSPLGGLVMGTRPGDLDPGVLLHLVQAGWSAQQLSELLYEKSGLLAVSETTSDMRALLQAAPTDPRAALAVEMFVYHARKQLGAMMAALSGLDILAFTGGIGEKSAQIRDRICAGFAFAGVLLDRARNELGESEISGDASNVSVRVIETNENLMVARHVRAIVQTAGAVR